MYKIITIAALVICCSATAFRAYGQQTPYLEKTVTVRYATMTYAELFKLLSEQTGIVFSYTSTFDDRKKVTVQYSRKQLRIVLNDLFDEGSCTYKMKGKYVILSCRAPEEKPKPAVANDVTINGYIYSARDSSLIGNASIYLRQNREAALSNEFGFFSMSFEKNADVLSVSVAKEHFRDTTIVILARPRNTIVIYLEPKPVTAIARKESPSDTTTVLYEPAPDSAGLPEEEPNDLWTRLRRFNAHVRNISDTLFTKVSFSFVPPISTNHLLAVNTVNQYSFNILVGVSRGVDKFELGGLVNIDYGDVKYGQIAGLTNLVSGNVTGVQLGGLVNTVGGNMNGVQIAGLVNVNDGNTEYLQIGGIGNTVRGRFRGAQIGGIYNVSAQRHDGSQIAGIANAAGSISGPQIAGIANSADTVRGSQIAGITNVAQTVYGFQLAGLTNHADNVYGSQIGLLNFAGTVTGVPFGLFSFVKYGYHKLELGSDEQWIGTAQFRTGVDAFHNIFLGGSQLRGDDRLWTLGYGLGSTIRLGGRWYMDVDLTAQHLQLSGSEAFDLNQLTRACIGAEWRMLNKLSIAFGPTVNWLMSDIHGTDYTAVQTRLNTPALWETTDGNLSHRLWVGGKVAIRFL